MNPDFHSGSDALAMIAVASYSATQKGSGIDITTYSGKAKILLNSAAGSGSMTLNVKLQHSDDDVDANYTDITGMAFSQVTTVASIQAMGLNVDNCKKYVRAVGTLGGASPVFVFGVTFIGRKQVV